MNDAEKMAYWTTVTDPIEALKILCENQCFLGTDPYYRDLDSALMEMAGRAALEPDPHPALGWRAMQTFACGVISAHDEYDQQLCCDGRECGCRGATVHEVMRHFIMADTGPTDEQALAEAVRLLSRDALMVENIDAVADACREFKIKPELFRAALAKIGEAK